MTFTHCPCMGWLGSTCTQCDITCMMCARQLVQVQHPLVVSTGKKCKHPFASANRCPNVPNVFMRICASLCFWAQRDEECDAHVLPSSQVPDIHTANAYSQNTPSQPPFTAWATRVPCAQNALAARPGAPTPFILVVPLNNLTHTHHYPTPVILVVPLHNFTHTHHYPTPVILVVPLHNLNAQLYIEMQMLTARA